MKKAIATIAILLAIACSWPVQRLAAAGYRTEGSATSASAQELEWFAAELNQKAERLQRMEQSMLQQQGGKSTDEDKSTLRWLGDVEAPSSGSNFEVITDQTSIEIDVIHPKSIAPRPAAQALLQQPLGQADFKQSSVLFAQANEDIFDDADQLQPLEDTSSDSVLGNSVTYSDPLMGMSCGNCCDACCGGNCDACCGGGCCCPRCCRRPCTIIAGTEAVFLAPDINGANVNYLYNDATFGATPFSYQFGPFWGDAAVDDFYVAPRLWLGVQGCRWGVVGRYFHMRVGENDFDRDPGGTYFNQAFNVSSVFEAYYTDLEVTRIFCLHGCKNQLSFGARYAAIEFNEQLYGRSIIETADPNDSGLLEGGARSNRYARGTGLTFGLNGRKPLFCNSCAHWFYSARSSILWGTNTNDVETRASVLASPTGGTIIGSAATIDNAAVHVDDDLFIGEFQLGVQWDFCLRCLPAKAFFRTAFEYQYWDASAGFAESGSTAGVSINDGGDISNYDVNTFAQAPGLIVDLYGVAIATGFTW